MIAAMKPSAIALLVLLALPGLASAQEYGSVPDFTLTERSGRILTKTDLLGKPMIVSFTFSRCAGPCPRIMNRMAQLATKLGAEDVRLVTITVDPEYDK